MSSSSFFRVLALSTGLVVAGSLTACGTDSESAASGKPVVVTSMYPIEFLVERLGGNAIDAVSLVTAGQDPHELELSLKQAAELAEADLAVHLKGFQPAVDDALVTAEPAEVLDLSTAVDLLEIGETEAEHEAHEAGAHEGEDHEGEANTGHDHGDEDPHFWLDATRMSAAATAVAEALTELSPESEGEIQANLATLKSDLNDLDVAFETGLGDCAINTVVVSHDAFGYLAARYNLTFEGINGLSPNAEPSLAHLAELRELIKSDKISTVFNEELASPELADTLAEDLGLSVATLDPIEGLSDETADEDYLSLMQNNLQALMKANQCSS